MTALTLPNLKNTSPYSNSPFPSPTTPLTSSATHSCTPGFNAKSASAYESVVPVDSNPPAVKMNILPLSSSSDRRAVLPSEEFLALISVWMRFRCVFESEAGDGGGLARSRAIKSFIYALNSRVAVRSRVIFAGSKYARREVLSQGSTLSNTGDILVLITITSASLKLSVYPSLGSWSLVFSNAMLEITFSASVPVSRIKVFVTPSGIASHLFTMSSACCRARDQTVLDARSVKHGATSLRWRGQSSPLDYLRDSYQFHTKYSLSFLPCFLRTTGRTRLTVSTFRPNVPRISLTLSGLTY